VWNVNEGSEEERIDKAISATESFFRSLGLATRLSENGAGDETIDHIVTRFNKKAAAYGEKRNVTGEVAGRILMNCK
jgi:NADP-dependent alcohol dehydrogenase